MSELILDTITGKTTATTVTIGSTPVVSASATSMTIRGEGAEQTSIQQGLAKVWVQHNDGTAADSFNMGTITDHDAGDFTYPFTNPMRAAGNYTISGFVSDNASRVATHSMNTSDEVAAAGSARINTAFTANTNGGTTLLDCNNTSLIIHGDLA